MAPAEGALRWPVPLPENGYTYEGLSLRERFAILEAVSLDIMPFGISEEELQQVAELRAALLEAEGCTSPPEDALLRGYYSRAVLMRYLRAKVSQERTLAALQKSIAWARTTHRDMLRKHEEEDHPLHKELMRKYTPDGLFGVDRRGMPVNYVRFGLRDTVGIMRETGPEVFQRFMVDKLSREGVHSLVTNLKREGPEGHATLVTESVIVIDCENLSWSRGISQLEFMMWLAENVLKDHAPEVTLVSFIVRAPWFFSMGWSFITPFIPAKTKEKFRIFGASRNFLDELQEFVELEQIPAFLGGKSPEPWLHGEGGEVPIGAGRLEAIAKWDARRRRKPLRRRRRAEAGEPWEPGGGDEDFDPDDRSLGPLFTASSPSSSSSASSPSWRGRRFWDRGDAAKAARQTEGRASAAACAADEGSSLLESAAFAFAAFGLHAALRRGEVLSAHASLAVLLGASAALQLLLHRRQPSRRSRPAAPCAPVRTAEAAAGGAAAEAGASSPQRQQLPLPVDRASELPNSDSWRSTDSGASKSSWSSSHYWAQQDLQDAPDASEAASLGSAAPTTPEEAVAAIADVFGQLGDVPGGLARAWPACVESWADEHSRSLRQCRRSPPSGWKTNSASLRPSVVAELPAR